MKLYSAHLIGIPAYRYISDVPAAKHDVDLLSGALVDRGFEVSSTPTDDRSQHSRAEIITAFTRACDRATGGLLLLYFSGHGLHYQGKDYLVPADTSLDYPEHTRGSLVCFDDIAVATDRSRADTVVLIIDACREGLDLGSKSVAFVPIGTNASARLGKRNTIQVFSCEPGQLSWFAKGDHGASYFTEALAASIRGDGASPALSAVMRQAQVLLDRICVEREKPRQVIKLTFERSGEFDPLDVGLYDVAALATRADATEPKTVSTTKEKVPTEAIRAGAGCWVVILCIVLFVAFKNGAFNPRNTSASSANASKSFSSSQVAQTDLQGKLSTSNGHNKNLQGLQRPTSSDMLSPKADYISTEPFPDVSKLFVAAPLVEDLRNKEIVGGYADGSFSGKRSITRYEAAFSFAEILGKYAPSKDLSSSTVGVPSDVPESMWAFQYVQLLADRDVLFNSKYRGKFRGKSALTVFECAEGLDELGRILVDGWDLSYGAGNNKSALKFLDVTPQNPAYASLCRLYNANCLPILPDNSFEGDRAVTRYQFAVWVDKFLSSITSIQKAEFGAYK